MLILGLAASVGRRALDSTIQQFAPHARRGRVYASLETAPRAGVGGGRLRGCRLATQHVGRRAGTCRVSGGDGCRARPPSPAGRSARAADHRAARRTPAHPRRDAGRASIITTKRSWWRSVPSRSPTSPSTIPNCSSIRQLVGSSADHDQLRHGSHTAIARVRAMLRESS